MMPSTNMADFLKSQTQAQAEAINVLGNKVDVCSWSLAPHTQMLYACQTCAEVTNSPVLVCCSCFLICHTSHIVEELWAKSGFSCDCPTITCPAPCALATLPISNTKFPANSNNCYTSHNFKGRYCWCDTPFSTESSASMQQCGLCQDWFCEPCIDNVSRDAISLGSKPASTLSGHDLKRLDKSWEESPDLDEQELDIDDDEDDEGDNPRSNTFICVDCVRKHPWVWALTDFMIDNFFFDQTASYSTSLATSPVVGSIALPSPERLSKETFKRPFESPKFTAKRQKISGVSGKKDGPLAVCTYSHSKHPPSTPRNIFLGPGFESHLCLCPIHEACSKNITSPIWEPDDDSSSPPQLETFLNTIPRRAAIETVLGYKKMKSLLYQKLKSCLDEGRSVTADDVDLVFSSLKDKTI